MSDGVDNLVGAIGDAIKTAPTLYEDAFQPAIQEVGKLAARIPRAINAAFSGLDKWILNKEYRIDETKKLLAYKLENVDPQKIVEPEPYVAIPAIQSISYSMNSEELRNLYANLLAKAMNIDTKETVHPAYIETIKQLSPDDAAYFKHIGSLDYRPMIDVVLNLSSSSMIRIAGNINLFSNDHAPNFELVLDGLSRLGLVNVPSGIWYGNESVYEKLISLLKKDFILENYTSQFPNAIDITFIKKKLDITTYGKNFYNTCCI